MRFSKNFSPSSWKFVSLLSVLSVLIFYVSYRVENPSPRSVPLRSEDSETLLNPSAAGNEGAHRGEEAAARSAVPAYRNPSSHQNGGAAAAEGVPTAASSREGAALPVTASSGPEATSELWAGPVFRKLGRPVLVLEGRVLDTTGRPIKDAVVILGERRTTTDSRGEFFLPQGTADLLIRHPDYFPRQLDTSQRKELAVSTGDPHRSRILLVLFRGGRIRGEVRNTAGTPVEGVRVTFSYGANMAGDSRNNVFTDPDGKYVSPLLHPGTHHLFFRHRDYQSWDTTVVLSPENPEARSNGVLKSGSTIRVHFSDPDGKDLPDVRVWLISKDPDTGAEESHYLGETGDQGELEARWDPALPHRIQAMLAGFRFVEEPFVGSHVSIRMEPAPFIAGVAVAKSTGLPVPLVQLHLEVETPEEFLRAPDRGSLFRALPEGNFRVGLPPFAGEYRVALQGEHGLFGVSKTVSFDGRTSPPRLSVRLEPQGRLQGILLHEDQPVEGARLELYRDIPARLRFHHGFQLETPPDALEIQTSDARGGFQLEDLSPGSYRIRATHPDFAEIFTPPISVPAPGPIPIVMRKGAELMGSVLDPDGEPAGDIPLILIQKDHPFPKFTSSAKSGKYAFSNLPDGTYTLLLGDPMASNTGPVSLWPSDSFPWQGFEAKNRHTLEVGDGKDVSYDIQMKSLGWSSVTGKVVSDGVPRRGLLLRLLGPNGIAEKREMEFRTNSSGEFRVHGLDPGTYRLLSMFPPFEREVQVESGKKALCSITFETQDVHVQIFDSEQGVPVRTVAEGEITFEPAHIRISRAPFENGTLTLRGLPPGTYRLGITAEGYLPHEEKFEISSDPVELAVRLRPGIRIRVSLVERDGSSTTTSTSIQGPSEVVLLRDGVEIYRDYGVIDGEVQLPVLEPGSYQITIRNGEKTAVSRFKVTPPRTDPEGGDGGDRQVKLRMP